MTALERRITEQARAVIDAEVLFGADSPQHRRQVARLATLQKKLPTL